MGRCCILGSWHPVVGRFNETVLTGIFRRVFRGGE